MVCVLCYGGVLWWSVLGVLSGCVVGVCYGGLCCAGKLRIIFICLCILAGVIEGATVLLIFRSAVNKLFERKQADVQRLSGIKDKVVLEKLNEIERKKREAKAKKRSSAQGQGKVTKFAKKGEGLDSDESSEDSDVDTGKVELEDDDGDDVSVDTGVDDEDGVKTNKANQKAEEESESAGGKRQNILALFYYLCLFFILLCLAFLGYECVYAITKAEGTASELNGASRRSYLAERMAYFAHELIYANGATTLVGSKALSIQSDLDGLRCQLTRSVQALLSVHYAMMYGTFLGWQDLPQKQHWAHGPVLFWGQEDRCSPFTWDSPSFYATAITPGSVGRPQSGDQDMTYFGKQCLAKLPKKFKDDNTVTYTNTRILEFTKQFYEWDRPCAGFDRVPEQDPVVSQGLHSFIIHMTDLGLAIAETPEERLRPSNREYVSLLSHDDDEWQLGLQKSVLIYQSEALTVIEQTTTYVTILYIFILLVVAAQYLFLGRRIEGLMQEHIGMSGIVNRFKEEETQIAKQLESKKTAQAAANVKGRAQESDDSNESHELDDDSELEESVKSRSSDENDSSDEDDLR